LLYHEWFPTITYDVHQMGPKGARLFVPPFFDPINPNLDPRISQGIFLLGSHMAADLAAEGKKGILTNAMYDNWWNGGNRTTPQRHNMVGVLSEAASVRMASPMFIDASELGGTTRGFASHRPAVNFVDPWPGGWWRLRDIVDYELIAARSVMTIAARYRRQFQSNYRAMARDAIARGKSEPPFAWVVPAEQRDPARAAKMVGILRATGVEVKRARSPFTAAGATYPAGSWILPASQPYRAHLKDMMERQVYPPRFAADGSAEPPYDVAGWTLPLQMGVRAVAIDGAFASDAEDVDRVEGPRGSIVGDKDAAEYLLDGMSDDIFRVLNDLFREGFGRDPTGLPSDPNSIRLLRAGRGADPFGEFQGRVAIRSTPRAWVVLDRALARNYVRLVARKDPLPKGVEVSEFFRPRRLGLYQPWNPSMDEGWTRLVLEEFGFSYTTLHNAEIRPGKLRERFDVILIPSIPENVLRNGFAKDATAPAYVGGLGVEGAAALREFVNEGGTIIGLEDSCNYLIHELNLPVKNVLAGLRSSEFYGPGSIVGAEIAGAGSSAPGRGNADPVLWGVPDRLSVYFDRSLAFEPANASDTTPLLRYAADHTLESGWLHGAGKIQGKTALARVRRGRGHVILFGFPPQHRGQTQGTFRLLFNAIVRG
jgi:hypothetical protein